MPKIRELIHGQHDPYAGFNAGALPLDMQGWGSQSPIFESVIVTTKAALIIEVGSWKGSSAINMASLMKKHGIAGEIVCVDTWLGGEQLWLDPQGPNASPRRFGRPTVYEQFIANIIHSKHTDLITPLPVDSITAATVLSKKQVSADAIYIDASHDYDHVFADLQAWWPLLKTGGIFFGDDYHPMWDGVIRAVNTFAQQKGLPVFTDPFPDKWHIQKKSQ